MKLTAAEQAYMRAVAGQQITDPDGRRRAWRRLESDFGYTAAARAWRQARRAVHGPFPPTPDHPWGGAA